MFVTCGRSGLVLSFAFRLAFRLVYVHINFEIHHNSVKQSEEASYKTEIWNPEVTLSLGDPRYKCYHFKV